MDRSEVGGCLATSGTLDAAVNIVDLHSVNYMNVFVHAGSTQSKCLVVAYPRRAQWDGIPEHSAKIFENIVHFIFACQLFFYVLLRAPGVLF